MADGYVGRKVLVRPENGRNEGLVGLCWAVKTFKIHNIWYTSMDLNFLYTSKASTSTAVKVDGTKFRYRY
jgi:hypothetical protein